MRALIPLYGEDYAFCEQIIANPAGVGIVVANNGTGPTPPTNRTLAKYMLEMRQAGVPVIGYVYTSHGQRPAAQVTADMQTWATEYGVDGVFIDNFATVTETGPLLSYYQGLRDAAKAIDPLWIIVANLGNFFPPIMWGLADIYVTGELYETQLLAGEIGPQGHEWIYEHPASCFAHIVENATAENLAADLLACAQRHAGYVFVTSETALYLHVPEFWAAEQQLIQLAA